MAQYNLEIKEVRSSLAVLVFVKIPDTATDVSVKENVFLWNTDIGFSSVIVPKTSFKYKFIGYSHDLKKEVILEHFSSQKEYYNLLSYHEILYSYSKCTGKWAVLVVDYTK